MANEIRCLMKHIQDYFIMPAPQLRLTHSRFVPAIYSIGTGASLQAGESVLVKIWLVKCSSSSTFDVPDAFERYKPEKFPD